MKQEAGLLALSTIRKNRGITLQQIADATKITVRSLEAIEREDFGKLPGGIYTTSYIRQYARAIDYDEDAILQAYQQSKAVREASASRTGGGNGKGMFGGFRPASTPV
jgi:cytoskeleton protein RodZ